MDAQTGGPLPEGTDVAAVRRSGTFWSIVLAVGAATASQGMMIPLLAVLDPAGSGPASRGAAGGEASGGAATAGIYGGLLFSMVFMERVVRRVGFRAAVCGGLVLGAASVLLFLAGRDFFLWLAWRFLFGMSLGAVHYGTQTWLGLLSEPGRRGRQMALYGFSAGVGFA
ncbi:MAG: hypothetical protein IRY98_10630, partial [Alicyclobacillaceae bacterium]|nr:hypothetical protein [Alicyclobacillaceae bacterium]